MNLPTQINQGFEQLRQAARELRVLSSEKKSRALNDLADRVLRESPKLLEANAKDVAALPKDTSSAFRDRLVLNPDRIQAMAISLRQVASLPDPVGELVEEKTLENGLRLRKIRAPFGVILMIFESRPNVILEAFSLAFKSGNGIALRGGSESRSSAEMLYSIMKDSLQATGINENSFFGINDYARNIVTGLLARKDWIDVVVPRGGDQLIEFVGANAKMPIIKNDRGLCHAYVDSEVDLDMAVRVVANAKVQRPGVCNSLETVLVHGQVAGQFLPKLFSQTKADGLEWRCDSESIKILGADPQVKIASEKNWDVEHLDFIINCKIVASLKDAMAHIARHGSKHSETILTRSEKNARIFQADVDAAVVYWNASTRFTDGFEFGLGGELGISTQKLHVRGPVGLRELTTPRWVVDGTGQVRG